MWPIRAAIRFLWKTAALWNSTKPTFSLQPDIRASTVSRTAHVLPWAQVGAARTPMAGIWILPLDASPTFPEIWGTPPARVWRGINRNGWSRGGLGSPTGFRSFRALCSTRASTSPFRKRGLTGRPTTLDLRQAIFTPCPEPAEDRDDRLSEMVVRRHLQTK